MTIISDIAGVIGDVQKALGSMAQAKNRLTDGGQQAADEKRFFERPMASVARSAKKSILYFPVVISESLSAETAATVAKAVQVRAAEYVRLWVSNMDPISSVGPNSGKNGIVDALRGATLKDAFLKDPESVTEHTAAVHALLRTRMSELVEHCFPEDGLRQPLFEAIPGGPKGGKPGVGVPGSNIPGVAPFAHLGKPAGPASQYQSATSRSNTGKTPAEQLDAAKKIFSNGTLTGREEAKKMVAQIMRQGDKGIIQDIKDAGLGSLVDQLETEMHDKLKQDAENHPSLADKKRLDAALQSDILRSKEMVDTAIRLATKATPQSRDAAIRAVQEIMAANDETDLARLRADKNTRDIVEMLEKLPPGVIEDGSYDITRTGNTVNVASNVDFNKVNQFLPVLLDLTVRYQTGSGGISTVTDHLVMGVKGVAHPVPSMDLVTGLGTALQRDNLVLQFFRMTSGETSFVKDFVLNLGVAKTRASGRTATGTKVLETLRRQAEWNDRRGNWVIASISKRGFVPPTTTICVTADEVDKIRTLYGVDFTKPSAVRALMQSHNLMGFMIVDEAIGLVRVFEDGDDDFDRLPIATLKTQGKETSVKDIMTILARS
jgi:hypothetical protein